jgi:4-hydroxy-tetrahydrodipicolinate reductase
MTEAPAPQTVHVVVTGCSGRMGRMLCKAAVEMDGVMLAGCTERPGSELIGQDAGEALGFGRAFGLDITDDPLPLFAGAHAVLDFTTPDATLAHAEIAAQARLTHVIGTTGFEPTASRAPRRLRPPRDHRARGQHVARRQPACADSRSVAAALDEDWDIEIVEMHHHHKVDAPSGTALMLGEAAAAGRGVSR